MDGSHLPTFVVVSVAIGIVALPKQLQVLLIAQGFTVGKADMAGSAPDVHGLTSLCFPALHLFPLPH